MLRFFRWLFGYVSFTFSRGFFENFITDCYTEGIEIRNISQLEANYLAYVNVKDYKKLHKIARKHGGVVKINEKYGLPFLLLPLKKRWGFFTGMAAFIFILSFLSIFIWNVEITGNSSVSDAALYYFLESENVKKGVMWSSVDTDNISWRLLEEFDSISYAHINRNGTTAVLEINEASPAPTGDEDKLKGINVIRRELDAVAYREQKDLSIKSIKSYKRLEFFFFDIPLYIKKDIGDISEESEKYLTLLDKELPIGIKVCDEISLNSKARMLTDEELEALARKKLSYAEKQELDGFEIINTTEEVTVDDDKCIIKCSYILRRK